MKENKHMKKTILFFILGISICKSLAQVNFSLQTSGTVQNLKGVDFLPNSNQGWAVGTGGVILTTTDGLNWTAQSSGVTATLEDVTLEKTLAGITFGWACGSSGTLLGTSDAGQTWEIQSQGAPIVLYGIEFFDFSNGVTVGSTANATTQNGGNLWTPAMTTTTLYSVDFISATTGWACGDNGLILKTTDGGVNWSNQTSGTTLDLWGIHFINANEGWASGISGTILHTTNGGVTWTAQTSNTANLIYEIEFFDAMNGWASGHSGTILHTTDGGVTWNFFHSGNTGSSAAFESIALKSGNEGWAVGSGGTIIHFIDESSSASLKEKTKVDLIQVYPNPVKDILSIDWQEEIESIEIYSEIGQLVQTESTKSFSVDNLQTGIYFLQTTTQNGKSITRFVKE